MKDKSKLPTASFQPDKLIHTAEKRKQYGKIKIKKQTVSTKLKLRLNTGATEMKELKKKAERKQRMRREADRELKS